MERLKNLLRQPEFHILLFGLFFILCNWPFLAIPGANGPVSMFYYLFFIWGIIIGAMYLVSKSLEDDDRD